MTENLNPFMLTEQFIPNCKIRISGDHEFYDKNIDNGLANSEVVACCTDVEYMRRYVEKSKKQAITAINDLVTKGLISEEEAKKQDYSNVA